MRRSHRLVQVFAMLGIIASLFSPVLTLPVIADDVIPEPEVTVQADGVNPELDAEAPDSQNSEDSGASTEDSWDGVDESDPTETEEIATEESTDPVETTTDEPTEVATETETPATEETVALTEETTTTVIETESPEAEETATSTEETVESDVDEPVEPQATETETPAVPDAVILTPIDPIVEGCGDALSVITSAAPEGVSYTTIANGDGSHSVHATLNPDLVSTHILSVEATNWTSEGDRAVLTIPAQPCPETETPNLTESVATETVEAATETSTETPIATVTETSEATEPGISKQSSLVAPLADPTPVLSHYHNSVAQTSPGGVLIVSAGFQNTSSSEVTNVQVQIHIPAGTTNWAFSANGSVPGASCGTLAAGTTVTCTIPSVPAYGAGQTLVMISGNAPQNPTASQCSPGISSSSTLVSYVHQGQTITPTGSTKSGSSPLTCKVGLSISNTASTTSVNPGGSFSYTIRVAPGDLNIPISNISVSFPLPSGLSFVSSPNCSAAGTLVTCNIASMTSESSESAFTINVQATNQPNIAQCRDGFTGTASIASHSHGALGLPSPAASGNTSLNCPVVMGIDLEVTPPAGGIYEPNAEFSYVVNVRNLGMVDAPAYTFDHEIPAVFSIVSAEAVSDGTGTCEIADSTNTIECEGSGVSATASHAYLIKVKVVENPTGPACTSTQTSTVTASWSTNNTATAVTPALKCIPQLTITMTADRTSAEPGDQIKYTVAVTNTGGAAASDYTFYSSLPADTRLTTNPMYVMPVGGWCFDNDEGSIYFDCQGPALAAGASHTYEFWANVSTTASPYMCTENLVSWYYGAGDVWIDEHEEANGGRILTVDLKCPHFNIAVDDTVTDSIEISQHFSYIIQVTNTGVSAKGRYSFVDTLPAGVELSGTLPTGCTSTVDSGLITITCTGENVPMDTTGHEYQINVRTSFAARDVVCGTLENQASGDDGWWNANTQTDRVQTVITCTPDLTLRIAADPLSAIPGDTIKYTVSIENLGASIEDDYAFDLNFAQAAPLTMDVAPVLPNGANCTGLSAGSVSITCTGSALDLAETHTWVFTARIIDTPTIVQCALVEATALASATSGHWRLPQLISEGVSAYTTLVCTPGLTSIEQPVLSPVVPGQSIGYERIYENTGAVDITELIVATTHPALPEGQEFTITVNDVEVSQLDPLALPQGDTVTIRWISPVIPEDIDIATSAWCTDWTQTADVTATFSDSTVINHQQDLTVQVNCTGLTITKEVSSATLPLGEDVTYTITVSNDGNWAVDPLSITDDLTDISAVFSNPRVEAEQALSCTDPESDATSITCEFAALQPGESLQMRITVSAPTLPTWEQCAPVENTATATFGMPASGNGQEPEIRVIESEPVSAQLDCLADVQFEKTATLEPGENNRMDPGDTVLFSFTITNSGNVALHNIVVTDDLANLEWESDSSIGTLPPGETRVLTARYTITNADLDSGSIFSTARLTASLVPGTILSSIGGTSIGLMQVAVVDPAAITISAESVLEIILEQVPGIDLAKTGSSTGGSDGQLVLGDRVTFTYTITNTGNVTLVDILVTDPQVGLEWTNGNQIANLEAGASANLTAEYSITQADIDAGMLMLCAEARGVDPANSDVSEADLTNNCVTLLLAQNPAILVAQMCRDSSPSYLPQVGEDVVFVVFITNTGDQTILNLTYSVTREGTLVDPLPASLAPGERIVLEWTTPLTAADYDSRLVNLEVTVTGETATGDAAQLASMMYMQTAGAGVEHTAEVLCSLGQLEQPVETPTPTTPDPTTPDPTTPVPTDPTGETPVATTTPGLETPAATVTEETTPPATAGTTPSVPPDPTSSAVTDLPDTGFGPSNPAAMMSLLAATVAIALLGLGAVSTRRR